MKELAKIRNDVVGSLLRPPPLKEARVRYDEAKMTLEELRQIEDQNIRDAVKLQEQIGLSVVTDGEYRRLNFQDSFGESVAGYDAGKPSLHFYEKRVEGSSPLRRWEIPDQGEQKGTAVAQRRPVAEKISLARNVPMEEFRFLRQVAQKPGKVALIGPDRISQRFDWQNSKGVYSGLDEFVADVVKVEREIIRGLVSTKVAQMESVDELKRRIDQAAKFAPLEQIAISPQCGFSSDVVGNLISMDDQKRKLELVVETARQVWG